MTKISGDATSRRARTGIAGLDEVLGGGLPAGRIYVIEGMPGTGKTTLALQFVREGIAHGERALFVTLSETPEELEDVVRGHGWTLDGIEIYAMTPSEDAIDDSYTIFHPSEVELAKTTDAVFAVIERIQPHRIVFDSLSELRLLAREPLRYRRQILAIKHFLAKRDATVLLLDDHSARDSDLQLQSLAHGVIRLEDIPISYGAERRRLRVTKLRGSAFRGGYHDFTIVRGGLSVFARLIAGDAVAPATRGQVQSGVVGLDALLNGGLDRGTSALFMGPAGAGKSTLALQYAAAAATRGEPSAIYAYDESLATLLARADGLGLDLRPHVEKGTVSVVEVSASELSPGELAYRIRRQVEGERIRLLVIDSLNGYLSSMPEERMLLIHLHELLSYTGMNGVLTLVTMAQHGILGDAVEAPSDVSYLADTVLLLRYFEAAGEVRQAISVVKKRIGGHERTIREFQMGPGIRVGAPLNDFHGILTGLPTFAGSKTGLLAKPS